MNFGAWTTVRARAFWMCMLETIYLKFRMTVVQKVTAVKLGLYNGGGNCFCGVKVKVGTDTADSTNVMIAGFRQCRYLIRKGKMFVKYEAKVARRLSIVSIEVEEL